MRIDNFSGNFAFKSTQLQSVHTNEKTDNYRDYYFIFKDTIVIYKLLYMYTYVIYNSLISISKHITKIKGTIDAVKWWRCARFLIKKLLVLNYSFSIK